LVGPRYLHAGHELEISSGEGGWKTCTRTTLQNLASQRAQVVRISHPVHHPSTRGVGGRLGTNIHGQSPHLSGCTSQPWAPGPHLPHGSHRRAEGMHWTLQWHSTQRRRQPPHPPQRAEGQRCTVASDERPPLGHCDAALKQRGGAESKERKGQGLV
jgi:hypothetical protein